MKIRRNHLVLLTLFVSVVCATIGLSWAQGQMPKTEEIEFSLTPPRPCKVPPKSPPDSLLRRKYKVENLTFYVHQLDLDGDGICDWLREGFETTVRDFEPKEENRRLENFMFLGTHNGWRRLRPLPRRLWLAAPGSEYWNRFGRGAFPIAVAVYQRGKSSPYLVAFDPPERTSSGDLALSMIGKWNATYELYEDVDDPTRGKVLKFLAKALCRDGPDPEIAVKDLEWSYARMMVTPQNNGLCPRK